MGRGRAKAKQTKVARELKYREFNTDFTELQRELHGEAPMADLADSDPAAEPDEDDDPYTDFHGDEQESARQR